MPGTLADRHRVRIEGEGAEVLARAHQPFFTTRGRALSRGLGLSSAQGDARQTGGELLLTSSPGLGTIATLVLPRP